MSQSSVPYKVLCVCLGNICRSPTAEVVLQQHIDKAGLNIMVDSAGTSNYHPNQPPDARSQKYAREQGYDLSHLRARQIQAQDFEQFDLILAMDHENLGNIELLMRQSDKTLKQGSVRAHLALMSQHDLDFPQQAIPDPYYGDAKDFERVIRQCESSSQAWIRYWQKYDFKA
ncbi:low molecular weight protein-tyrosine-phosphatase [Acinetobacter puyangensis]|uniref:protein-tyrosine-phosphatase n=1 Tax=Acinetobacter puyangensis TaxID=1096779 RepID=A0A240E7E6_9GAMM|nr:low molecular weight protein-tyrosine-phosphatase [Acinetobacter puyangensis]SNX44129.1 protein-tyrosine phosphatase [Acinetobacter puyangensis]